jgi:pilin isopeptide linkage protein
MSVMTQRRERKNPRAGRRLAKRAAILTACLMVACLGMAPTALATEPGEVTLTVTQTITNGEAASNPEFRYQLIPESAASPLPAGSAAGGYSFDISGATAAVGPITYASTGSHTYTLRCVSAAGSGYTLDAQVYTIEVYVKAGLDCDLVLRTAAGDKTDALHFTHTYTPGGDDDDDDDDDGGGKDNGGSGSSGGSGTPATPTTPGTPIPSDPAVMVNTPVVSVVSGNPDSSSVFTFRLAAENSGDPMPEGSINGVKALQITGEGSAGFGAWSYTAAGVYRYTVSQVNRGEEGYQYDTTVYTITDTVREVAGQLEVTRVVTGPNGELVGSMVFVNTYAVFTDRPGGTPPKTGDSSHIALFTVTAGASLALLLFLLQKSRRAAREEDVSGAE